MNPFFGPIKNLVKLLLQRAGYKLVPLRPLAADPLCEGFHEYQLLASQVNSDVNDWIESVLQWEAAKPTLEAVVFPYLSETSCVCEIGPGTGRHARLIVNVIPNGQLHLFDHSVWIQEFLCKYFACFPAILVHKTDGRIISLQEESVDLVFSSGTFIELKLGEILLLAHQFSHILRVGGHAVFDFIDVGSEDGWAFLSSRPPEASKTFTYHSKSAILKVIERGRLYVRSGLDSRQKHICCFREEPLFLIASSLRTILCLSPSS